MPSSSPLLGRAHLCRYDGPVSDGSDGIGIDMPEPGFACPVMVGRLCTNGSREAVARAV